MLIELLFAMSVLQRKFARRKGLRTNLASVIGRVEVFLSDATVDRGNLIGIKSRLNNSIDSLNEIYDEIIALLDPADIENDVIESAKVLEPTFKLIADLDLKVQALAITCDSVSVGSTSSSTKQNVKLPKLELPIFKGNPLEWQGFWDQYLTSIHQNDSISDIDRFNYLKKYLSGPASDAISGLSLGSENYKEAIALLTDRFGNSQVLITAHMESLIKIKKLKSSDDLEGLRKLYTDVEKCVRNLKSLKIETATYGCMLIPILNDRLPEDLCLLISRKFGSDLWTLDLLLKYLNEEIQAKERCTKNHAASNDQKRERKYFSASGLNVQNDFRRQKCVYCYKDEHSPSRCKRITNVKSRTEILRRFGKCFICLQSVGKGLYVEIRVQKNAMENTTYQFVPS